MRPVATLGAYGLALAAALGGGAAVGALAGPIDVGDEPVHDTDEPSHGATHAQAATGLTLSEGGYTLAVEDRVADEGPFSFRILGPDGEPETDFAEVHDKRLHLIVVSRDLAQYHHLHPTMDAGGRWTAQLPVLRGGAYRAFADFEPTGGEALTLGIDLTVTGTAGPGTPPEPTDRDEVDGYAATLDGQLVAGQETTVTVSVRRDGRAVRTEPYLGARGHLVALRDGDLAYLHVHPVDGDGDEVSFEVEVPSAGRYALFFDFQHDGVVRTARFVVDVDHHDPGSPATGDDH